MDVAVVSSVHLLPPFFLKFHTRVWPVEKARPTRCCQSTGQISRTITGRRQSQFGVFGITNKIDLGRAAPSRYLEAVAPTAKALPGESIASKLSLQTKMLTNPEQLRDLITTHLDDVLVDARIPQLPNHTPGKVRDSYDLADGRRIIITTDRQSAFDQILAAVPFKGQVLNGTARFWFDATKDIVANHTIDYPDPNVMIVRRLRMLPVEVVVRDYLTGTTSTSIWPMYRDGQRQMYGLTLPDGLRKNEKLPETILTPTTKALAGQHDTPIAPEEIVDRSLLSAEQWAQVRDVAFSLFARGQEISRQRNLILVDTKYEFGYDDAGKLVLADEIHTPDSSRYWRLQTYSEKFEAGEDPETLDKDFLRRWIIGQCDPYRDVIPAIPKDTLIDFSARYISLYETITGNVFSPAHNIVPAIERIRQNLRAFV